MSEAVERTPVVVTDLRSDVRKLGEAFADGLERILDRRFAGLFIYGAACFPPSPVSDFDYHVLLTEPLDDAQREALLALHGELARDLGMADDMDGYYVTLDAAARSEPPRTELKPDIEDGAWALHRAHIHAGRYAVIRGIDPKDIVPEPTWAELDETLQDELEWCIPHLEDARAYCVLQLCRILHSYESADVVTSKLRSAMWSFAALPASEHALIRDALDAYFTKTYAMDEDIRPFFDRMSARIVRARALS